MKGPLIKRFYSVGHPRRRVVCTGMGVVSPLGCTVTHAWNRLINGETGVVANNRPGFENIPSKVAAFVPRGRGAGEFADDTFTKHQQKYLSLSMMYALAASREALHDADWINCSDEEKINTGVAIGTGMVDLETISQTSNTLAASGYRKVSPYFVPKILSNLSAGHVSIEYGFRGPNHTVSTACTTGANSIGDAMRFIRNRDADVMVCGSTEAPIVPVSVAGFARARALSTSFPPEVSSRPFDKHRDGFIIGEGAAVLVLEEFEHALRRGVDKIYGEIMGYGLSGDAYQMTLPPPDGSGAVLSMHRALHDAQITPSDINYVNAHATSTRVGDAIENKAIKALLGGRATNVKVSSFKGATGHLLGAAGSLETAFTLLALYEKIVPPTINLFEKEPEFSLDYTPNEAVKYTADSRRVAIKNSFGFGGVNASLCLGEM